MHFSLVVRVLYLSLFCYALLYVQSSFAIILKWKRKLVVLLLLSDIFLGALNVVWLFTTVGAGGWSAVCDSGIS